MGLLKTAGKVAVASAVHGRIQRRQQKRWAAEDAAADQTAPIPQAPPAAVDDMLTQLERLGKLRESGVLTDAEFSAQKARLLG